MVMNANELVQAMQTSVPNFLPNAEYVQDGLTYYIINDLGSFICKSALGSSWKDVREGLNFLDDLLAEGNAEAEKLVGDCIWGLLDCPAYPQVQALLEGRLRELSKNYPPK